jgi:Protein of unknown function (DUF2934)
VNRTKVGQKPESKQDGVKGKEPVSGGENIAPSLEEQISRRAYELYEQRGKEHGRADEDWLKAEKEIIEGKGSDTNPLAKEVK